MQKKKDYDLEAMVSTSLGLFAAGYDSTSSAIARIAHKLALHPDVQERIFEEIKEAMEKHGDDGVLAYDKVNGLEYLEMVIYECMRVSPGLPLQRSCGEDVELAPGIKVRQII